MLDDAPSLALDTGSNALDIDGNICGDTGEGRIDYSFIENNLDMYASEVVQGVQGQNLPESGTIDSESEVEESLQDLIPSGALDKECAAITSVDTFPSSSESRLKTRIQAWRIPAALAWSCFEIRTERHTTYGRWCKLRPRAV